MGSTAIRGGGRFNYWLSCAVRKRKYVMASDDLDFRKRCDWMDGKSAMRPVHVGARWFVDRG